MGLTIQSTGFGTVKEMVNVRLSMPGDIIVALAGNPNTGKSTVFNSLTGLNRHTGNWTGKTVSTAYGNYKYKDVNFVLVDLPGTYSLLSNSAEEEIARDFICFGNPNATVVVADATCLERNLNLVLQILEITGNVVLCTNFIDEAGRKKINVDIKKLSEILGVPVVATNAREGRGLDELMDAVYNVSFSRVKSSPIRVKYNEEIERSIKNIEALLNNITERKVNNEAINKTANSRWVALRLLDGDKAILSSINKYLGINPYEMPECAQCTGGAACTRSGECTGGAACTGCTGCAGGPVINEKSLVAASIDKDSIRDQIASSIIKLAEEISGKVVSFENQKYNCLDRKIDMALTSKIFGIPAMLGLLGLVFWITMEGANMPSEAIARGLFRIEGRLTDFFVSNGLPEWLHGALVHGMYRTLAWVVSVMLPPMAIFFPLFSFLEDLGYLPRVAFNLDNFFKKACAHGKQALTMCMGFGCNAAGVIGCRIIDSPRERLIAIITNFFVPCNGRFPTLIAITAIFIAGAATGIMRIAVAALTITSVIVLGILMTLAVSKILSKTILKGVPSSFALELPPYRKPQIGKIIIRSIFDRTMFVLGRAVVAAAPAGLFIWILANVDINGLSLLDYCAGFLQPFAYMLGMDGYILLAFILGLPANEIVVPIILMSYMATGSLIELENLQTLKEILISNGWTWLTAVNVMLFCLMHFPCATTLLTIKKETKSLKWTFISFLVPTAAGISICFTITQVVRLSGLI